LLESARNEGLTVIDEEGFLFEEYFRVLGLAGRPGVGRAFVKWLYDNQFSEGNVERVHVSPTDGWRGFEEFPDDDDLKGFDLDDHKFVAAARASDNDVTIYNAVDSDWGDYREALAKYVTVVELCEQ
jgi:hypothetical protein